MRRYGPHDPATAPRTVVVLGMEKWPPRQGVVVPMPQPLIDQRRQINERAAQ